MFSATISCDFAKEIVSIMRRTISVFRFLNQSNRRHLETMRPIRILRIQSCVSYAIPICNRFLSRVSIFISKLSKISTRFTHVIHIITFTRKKTELLNFNTIFSNLLIAINEQKITVLRRNKTQIKDSKA